MNTGEQSISGGMSHKHVEVGEQHWGNAKTMNKNWNKLKHEIKEPANCLGISTLDTGRVHIGDGEAVVSVTSTAQVAFPVPRPTQGLIQLGHIS